MRIGERGSYTAGRPVVGRKVGNAPSRTAAGHLSPEVSIRFFCSTSEIPLPQSEIPLSLHVVIIGNGIAGTTAARFVRKAGARHRITMISDETEHPYARTSLMYVFMGHVRYDDIKLYEDRFWDENRIERVRGRVVGIDPETHRVELADGNHIGYDRLLVATGSASARGGWPGESLPGVHRLYGITDVERLDAEVGRGEAVRRAVVVGGGLTGVELSEMLHTRGVPVTFLVREHRFIERVLPPEESARIEAEIRRHGIDLRMGTAVARFIGTERVEAVETTDGETIPADLVGTTVGVRPNVSALDGSGIETRRGVLVDEFLQTSAADVFAAGDCVEWRDPAVGHTPVEQLWYSGRRQGFFAARNLLGERVPYEKGVFFNSAKFYTLEWQTYGLVPTAPETSLKSVLWQDGHRLVRLVYHSDTLALRGVSVLGVRYRADVCTAWIKQGTLLPEVIADLPRANFDPEFHRRPEPQLQQSFAAVRSRLGVESTLILS